MIWCLAILALLLAGPVLAVVSGQADLRGDWRSASRESSGLAPPATTTPEAVVQVYGARTFGWRGAFAVHTWISVKPAGAGAYTTFEVIGWRYWHGGSALAVHQNGPDRRWYGAQPELYVDLRGPAAAALVQPIAAAAQAYPYKEAYRSWPGPNSNTFTAFIGRAVPGLGLDLPPTAIGKDYLGTSQFFAVSPSGSGYQASLFGLFGLLVAREEGLEVNLLGLNFGLDPLDLAVKLPGLGRYGLRGDGPGRPADGLVRDPPS